MTENQIPKTTRQQGAKESVRKNPMVTQTDHQPPMKVHEVAQRLGVSKQVVYEMIKKKTLPSLKYPGTDIIRVLWSDFEAFVRASRQTGEDDLPELRPLPPITKDYFAEDPAQPPVKRKRGRPRKYPLPS